MNYKTWPDWLKGGIAGKKNKLIRADFAIIAILSVILSALTLLSNIGYFYYLEDGNKLLNFIKYTFIVPYIVVTYPLFLVLNTSLDSEGSALGSAMFGAFLSPLIAFILWPCLFYVLSKASNRLLKNKKNFLRHGISLILFTIIVVPYAYYMFGTNTMSACLSGKFNYIIHTSSSLTGDFLVGPESCFKTISGKTLGYDNNDFKKALAYCEKLSDKKLVFKTDFFYQKPEGLSYQDYCLLTLKPLPTKELCEATFKNDFIERNRCIGYFTWMNQPRLNTNFNTYEVKFDTIDKSEKVVYEDKKIILLRDNIDKPYTWFAGYTQVKDGLNIIEFDAEIALGNNSTRTVALLTVYVNAEKVGQVDGRLFADGKRHFKFEFPAYQTGSHSIIFRLDTYTQGIAKMIISNLAAGFKNYPGVWDVPHGIIQ